MKGKTNQAGFTLVELVISIIIFSIVAFSMLGLFASLVRTAVVAKRKAVASTLATNEMEYLRSLPYNNLAVLHGDIYATSPLPNIVTQTINGVVYTTKISISYVDDAFDGCGPYPSQALKQQYCRNYPPPGNAPAQDSNPADYKIAHVSVQDPTGTTLAQVDTEIAARVAETASTTGALFVKVIDSNGNPVSGANINVVNNNQSPAVNLNDNTDSNGESIFYGLPPDTTNYHYVITASATGYSSLTTIPQTVLVPNYPSQNIFTQQSSSVTLTLKLQGANSLVLQTTDTNGNPLDGVKVYVKGGYKKYTSGSDTSYYFDNFTPTDTRPTTAGGGYATLSNLVPGNYIFCGDTGASNCKIGNTTYYLAAAVPYGGTNPFNPIVVPIDDPSNPPVTTFPYGGTNYLQQVRLMLTQSSSFPRVTDLNPYDASLAAGVSNFIFTIDGVNLPCTASGVGCGTTVKFVQGGSTFTASCTGDNTGLTLACKVNLTSVSVGNTQLVIGSGGNTLTLPAAPLLGGIIVSP